MKTQPPDNEDEEDMRQYLSPKDLRELMDEEQYGRRVPKAKDLKKLKRKTHEGE